MRPWLSVIAPAMPGMPACARSASTYAAKVARNWSRVGGSAVGLTLICAYTTDPTSRAFRRTSRLYHFGCQPRLYTPGNRYEETAEFSYGCGDRRRRRRLGA